MNKILKKNLLSLQPYLRAGTGLLYGTLSSTLLHQAIHDQKLGSDGKIMASLFLLLPIATAIKHLHALSKHETLFTVLNAFSSQFLLAFSFVNFVINYHPDKNYWHGLLFASSMLYFIETQYAFSKKFDKPARD